MKKSMKKVVSAVSMLALSFAVVFAAGCSKKAADGEKVDISAMNADTYKVTEVTKDKDGNYVVTAHSKGYSEEKDINLAVTFDGTASKVLKVEVLDQAETEGLGAKIAEEDFLKQFEGIAVPVSTSGSVPENPAAPADDSASDKGSGEAPATGDTAAAYVDGTYTAEAPEFSHGYKDVVTVVISGGKIASVDYNPLAEEGGDKRKESEAGEYVMTEDGPLWHEQSDSFGQYVVDNQGTGSLALNDEGKTDAIAGVSIALGGAVDLVNQCLAQASGTTYTDGTYTAEAPEFSHGYKDVVTVVISGGKIASVDYNPLAEEGGDKRKESEAGEYVMTEDGPLWHEQSDSFGQYVVDNQGTGSLALNDEGKTDAIAGVSIALGGAVDLVNQCLAQASGSGSTSAAAMADGTYTAEAAEFSNGYKDVVTVVVAGGKITSVDYNPVTEEGGDKRAESEAGEYVMTEDGPLWHEQSDSFGQYVVNNQGTDGLTLNDEGKTDAIAGVSIALGGATNLVNDCIAQAVAAAGGSAPEAGGEPEAPAVDAATFDAISGATVSSKAVARIINNAYYFLTDNVIK